MMHNAKYSTLLAAVLAALSIVSTFVVVVEAQFDNPDFGGGEAKFCHPFKCRKGQEPVPKWPYKVKSMGCASSAGGMVTLQPSQSGPSPLEDCCHSKQVCLQTCGSVKHLCQGDFLKCGERTCAAIGNSKQREDCTRTIEMQKMLQGLENNCREYDNYQRQNCKCVDEDDAPKERVKFLTRFYEKYNPEDVSKAKNLAAKADTARKLSTVIVKLVQKYPGAIKIIEDPNKAMMDKIMKEANQKKDGTAAAAAAEGEDESAAEDMGTEEL